MTHTADLSDLHLTFDRVAVRSIVIAPGGKEILRLEADGTVACADATRATEAGRLFVEAVTGQWTNMVRRAGGDEASRLAAMVGKLGDYVMHDRRCDLFQKRPCSCGLSPLLQEITTALQEINNG